MATTKPEGLVANIQRYATKDGPGLRTTAFLIGCNLRCLWCSNPEAMLPGKKAFYDARKCRRCGCCVAAAHNHAVTLGENGCEIDRERCDNLMDMVDVCPYDAWEAVGRTFTPEGLYDGLRRDRVFYENSGGGVTFSGGEPLLQKDFLHETMKLLKRDGIHLAIDTAGLWNFEEARPVLELADLVLYDIKAFDEGMHRACTGVGNATILDNARKLAAMDQAMWVRMVIAPEWNDDLKDIEKRLRFVKELGPSVKRVDVLRYHNLGEGKYLRLGMAYPLAGLPSCSDELTTAIQTLAEEMSIEINVE